MLRNIKKFMPEIYFKIVSKEERKEHKVYINKILDPQNHNKTLSQKNETKEYFICNYNIEKLKNKILKVVSESKNDILLYRIFPNQKNNFILTSFYENLNIENNNNEFDIPENNDFKKLFLGRNGKLKEHVDVHYITDEKKEKTTIKIKCVNVAHNTLISNIFETLQRHKLTSEFIEIWQIKKSDKKIKSYYEISIILDSILPQKEMQSMKDDFIRYLQLYIKSMSIFDMV